MNLLDFEVSLESICSLSTCLTVRISASFFSSRMVSLSSILERPLEENLRGRGGKGGGQAGNETKRNEPGGQLTGRGGAGRIQGRLQDE